MSLPSSEQWRPVPGYEGYYEVSDQGRVRSLDRLVVTKAGWSMNLRGRLMTPTRHYVERDTGRRCIAIAVNLKRDGSSRTVTVHKLVMAAFIGPRPEGQEVCHRNGDAQDCRLANIHYGTASENALDRVRHGVHNHARKTHCPLGHPLTAPNLVRGAARRGNRSCLACNRARAYKRFAEKSGRTYDLVIEADNHYGRIMAGRRTPTPQQGARA